MQHSLNFDNLDGKLAQDEAEHRHAESKLTIEDNIEQEPNVKIVESTAGNKGGTSTKKLADTDKSATELKDNATGVQLKPLSEIHTDEGRFQERFKLNEQIVNNIAEKFSYADQDPIHVWTDPKDGKTYVLSGHHRYYGAKKAGIINVKIQDRTGDFTEAQAIEFATEEANANRSMGTPLERANTLRKKRKKGDSKEAIQKFLNKEGKNKNYVENLSHLNPDGKTITSLISLEESSDKVTQKESEKIADWIGEARKQNKNLTDQHENELFDFLMNKDNSKRISTKADFISKVASLTNTLDFDPSKPLNIERYKYKSEGEKLYEEEVEKHKNKISELQQKINDINDRFKNPNNPNYVSTDHKDYESIKAQADKVISDTNVQLKAEQKALQELYQQKGKYTNAGSGQGALFQQSNDSKSGTDSAPKQQAEARSVIKFLSDKFKDLFAGGQKELEERLKIMGHAELLKDKNGDIFGIYDQKENKIYLNERNLNPKTVWHEATHFQQAMIKAMAKNGNKEAKKILAQYDKLLKPFIDQLLLGRKIVTIDGQKIDLSPDVYRKGAKETTKAYKERMQDEVWAFLQQEENHKLWQKNDTAFKRAVNKFREAITNLYKSVFNIPKGKDISNMTLQELVEHTAKQLQGRKLPNIDKLESGNVQFLAEQRKSELKGIADFIKDVLDGKGKGSMSFTLPKSVSRQVENKIGHPVKSHSIHANEVRHINNNHGENGKKNTDNSIPLRKEDIALAPYIMTSPTRVEKGTPKSDGTQSVRYVKEIGNGTIIVVEQEGRFDVEDMSTITMWAETNKKSHSPYVSDARINTRPLNSTSEPANGTKANARTVIISANDVTKIIKDAENAIDRETGNSYRYQITDKDGNKKTVRTLPQVTNGFYSPIEKKLLDEKATNLSATKWLERLGKGDEMTFTGLKDFLESKKPNEQVKKSELQDFMRDNRIEVVEVVKGGEISEAEIDAFLEDEVGEGYTREEAREYLSNDETNEQTKYHEYQLDGEKENYKEVLVTMPKREMSEAEREEFVELQMTPNPQLTEKQEAREEELRRKAYGDDNFKSSHFDEPNILVHLRMNTRTDSEGNKVLFLEEVQSDWGQTGKRNGFEGEEVQKLKEEYDRLKSEKEKAYQDAVNSISDTDIKLKYNSVYKTYELITPTGTTTGLYRSKAEAIQGGKEKLARNNKSYLTALERQKTFENEYGDKLNRKPTPTAPFVTDTNAWVKLGLKVALKEAVTQGADKISWTTGEQQNARYDLSKQVDSIKSYRNSDGTYSIQGIKDGEVIFSQSELQEAQLEGVIGKELANKIINNEGTDIGTQVSKDLGRTDREFTGKDLQVGGSGMKGFYGSPTENKLGIVGNVAKKLFGQEPTTIKLKDGTEQHAVTITPEMRETVQEGQPLFMAGKEDPTPITLVSDKKSNNDIRFQILGEKGAEALDKFDEATHRMDNLSIARQMEEANKTPKEIRLATGWERGKDKKWRYEIEDIEIDINKSKATYLDEITTNDKGLFISHPELKGIDVIISIDSKNNNTASYTPFEDRSGLGLFDIQKHITVEAKTKEDVKTLLLHEIQHAIQDIEGFAEGGNPKMAENLVDRNRAKEYTNKHNAITLGFNEKERTLKNRIFNSTDYIDSFSKKEYDKYLVFSNIYHLLSNGETLKELPDLLRIRHENIFKTKKEANAFLINNKPIIQNILRDIEKKIKEFEAEKKELIKETNEEINNLKYEYYDTSPYEQYKRLAGEVESRNVQSRMNMTPEQRRETLLTETEDVAREDQIVMMDGVEQAMSLSETKPITQTQSKTLIDWLNKAFGGKVRLFSDWSRFIEQNKALQGFKSLDDIIFSQTLDKVNKAFNEQLDKLIKGTLPKGHIFQLGNAGAILKASGIEELPIELSADRTKEKSEQPNHPFDLNDLKNLTKAVQNPIAVFDSTKKDGSKIILTELKDKKGNNYVVALRVSNKGAGRLNVEINDVKSVYPKDHTQGVLDWINSEDNLLRYADKEKALDYISVQSTNLIGNGNAEKGSTAKIQQDLDNAIEKIKNFENPISDKEVDDVRFAIRRDRSGNEIGDGSWNVEPSVINLDQYPQVETKINYSENTESSYVTYTNTDNGKSIKVRFSTHENNATKFGDQLDGFRTSANEILFRIGLKNRTFTPSVSKSIGAYQVKRKEVSLYKEADKTIQEIYALPIGADLSKYKGKVAKNSNWVIGGDIVKEVVNTRTNAFGDSVPIGDFTYSDIKFLQLPDGTVYGAVLPDGSMYLNPEKLNANTPIHEHTHLFNQVIQQTNPKLWNRMVEAVKGIGLWNEVKNDPNYKNLKTDSQIADEVYSRLTGNKGEVNWQERIAKADSKSRLAKVGELIKEYWNNVMDILGIKKMSADDFANMTLDKLFSGKEIKGAKEVLNANKRQGLSELQYSMLGKSDFDKDGNVKPEVLEEIRKEREKIVSEAKANGTYMKAPNGQKSNLNEQQWVDVRTKRFKDWFGDWENGNKLDLINNTKPTPINPNNFSLKQIEEVYQGLENGVNKYDNRNVRFVNSTLGKILRHKGFDAKQIVPQLKQIFDNAVPIISEAEQQREGHKQHSNFKGYHHYLGKVSIDGKEMFVRFTVQEKDAKPVTIKKGFIPNEVHSTFISDVEIYNADPTVHTKIIPVATNAGEGVTDTKLQNFFENAKEAKENSSKVIDENGEPLVVYHGTDSEFNEFDINAPIKNGRGEGNGFYFIGDKNIAKKYGKPKAVFLNIKKFWKGYDSLSKTEKEIYLSTKSNSEAYKKLNVDGIEVGGQIIVFSPNQIKSATDNVGTFSNESNDIRFSIYSGGGKELTEEERQEIKEDLKLGIRLGNTVEEITQMYAETNDLDISEKDFKTLLKEVQDEIEAENNKGKQADEQETTTKEKATTEKDSGKKMKTFAYNRVFKGDFPQELKDALIEHNLEHETVIQDLENNLNSPFHSVLN